MTDKEKVKIYEELLEESFGLDVNMNDTFGFGGSDNETIDGDDFEHLLPIIGMHGRHHALVAYVAVKRSLLKGKRIDPISCHCHHDGPGYESARTEIEKLTELDKEGYPKIMFGAVWRVHDGQIGKAATGQMKQEQNDG